MECLVTTTLDSTEEDATLKLTIQGATETTFGTAVDLASSAAIVEDSLAAGYIIRVRMPALDTMYQFIRGYLTVGTHNFTSGAVKVYMLETPVVDL